MGTKELNDLKQSLKKQYFDSTGRDVDKHRSSLKMFIEHIRSDVQKYIYEQLTNDNDIDYFFNVDDIKTLINIYFKKIKLDYDEFNNIKHSINIFADKYSNFLPNFSTYSLYSIAEIISFNVIALLNKKYNNYKYIYKAQKDYQLK